MRRICALLALTVVVAACGGDDDTANAETTTTATASTADGAADDTTLSAAEREWCTFATATETDATRFDRIFEAGLSLGLNMDALNARASGLRTDYEAGGMTPEAAIQAVSQDLFGFEDFVSACREAYSIRLPG